jgi:hypothetical protein
MEDQQEESAHAPDEHNEPTNESTNEPTKANRKHLEHWLEAITAIMLGVVAVATAWSGYQSARWSGVQSFLYSEASALRVESARASTEASEDRIYDVNLFDGWLSAYAQGDTTLATIYAKRFRPEFLPAFSAWLVTDPFHNPNAPQGPLFMPQYQLSHTTQANLLAAEASRVFKQAQDATQHSDDYVLNTVFLAVVLFLTAISERFEWQIVRVGILILATAMLLFGLYNLLIYPIT